MRYIVTLLSTIIALQSLCVPLVWSEQNKRPFWTEKSSFIEGQDLYVVGIASNAKAVEEGRKQAFENGKVELMNFAQVTSLEARGLVIETQMTYEEPNPNGTVTVYRLLRVSAEKLAAVQGRLQEQSRVQEQVLDKARIDLQATQQSVAQKQQQLETQSRQIETTLDSVSRLQENLGQKATRIEQAQREVERLLQELSAKVKKTDQPVSLTTEAPSKSVPAKAVSTVIPLLGKLKETEARLDAQEAQLNDLAKRAKDRLAKEGELARALEKKCKYLEPGMTKKEVEQIMSEPTETNFHPPSKSTTYYYRYMNKKGHTEMISVGFAFNNLVDTLDYCPGKSFGPYDHLK